MNALEQQAQAIDALLRQANDVMGGSWGNHITWTTDEWPPLSSRSVVRAYGHKPPHAFPEVGHLIAAKMRRSWFLFEVIEVEPKRDPPDMFFLSMRPVKQVMKR